MTDMIAAEPCGRRTDPRPPARHPAATAAALADAVRAALDAGDPVVVTGCGTSEHGALAVAEILREATGSSGASPAPRPSSCRWIRRPTASSSASRTRAGRRPRTRRCGAAREAGASTALITVTRRSPGAALADVVVETDELDQSWCHTVGYLSPIAAAAAVAGAPDRAPVDAPARSRGLVAAGTAGEAASPGTEIADGLAGVRPPARGRVGSGSRRPAASSRSRSRRAPGSRPPTATSRRSCTAISPRPDRRRGSWPIATDRRAAGGTAGRLAGALRGGARRSGCRRPRSSRARSARRCRRT